MKLMYGSTPVKALNIHKLDMDTNDATIVASDMQSGMTAYARGQKVTGTGKAFAFAMYGGCSSNAILPIPVSTLNTVNISCANYAVKMSDIMLNFRDVDFSTAQTVAVVTVGGTDYPITVTVTNNTLTVSCSQNITLEVMFGKDEHV